MENPPKKFFRLSPGNEVRLRYAYFIKCREVDQERRRRGRRAALHLRSRDQGRQRARRPQGQGDHALAAGGAVAAGGNPHLQPAVRQAEPGRGEFRRRPQSAVAGDLEGRADRAGDRARAIRPRRCSSSGRAISCAIRIPRRTGRCSTAPSACATPLRRKSAARAETGSSDGTSATDDTVSAIMAKWAAASASSTPTRSRRSIRRTHCSSARTRSSIAAMTASRPISTDCRDGIRRAFASRVSRRQRAGHRSARRCGRPELRRGCGRQPSVSSLTGRGTQAAGPDVAHAVDVAGSIASRRSRSGEGGSAELDRSS